MSESEIKISPEVLKWARETIGKSEFDVAKSLKTSPEIILQWESGAKNPTRIQLEKLSQIYKRPTAILLLSHPPKEEPLPKDFRSLPDKERSFSSYLLLAIRKARRAKTIFNDLSEDLGKSVPQFNLHIDKNTSAEDAAINFREKISSEIERWLTLKNEDEALEHWRKVLEALGVLVIQVSMPMENGRAFSLDEKTPPVIVLNKRDAVRGRIFSLFHELCHLMLNNTGVCNMEDSGLDEAAKRVETFCNYFSGAFLVPKGSLLNHNLIQRIYYDNPDSDILKRLSSDYKVSREVILRRLVALNKVSAEFYKKKREEWQKIPFKKRFGGKPNPPKRCIQENGRTLTSLVIDGYRKDKITYRDAGDFLSTRLKYLPKVEKIMGGEPG